MTIRKFRAHESKHRLNPKSNSIVNGERVRNTWSKYAMHTGTVESNVYQRTVDYPDEWANGYHIMLDSEELVTFRWEQVESAL